MSAPLVGYVRMLSVDPYETRIHEGNMKGTPLVWKGPILVAAWRVLSRAMCGGALVRLTVDPSGVCTEAEIVEDEQLSLIAGGK